MNNATLKNILAELESVLCGQRFGKIFLLAKFDLAIDFRLNEGKYLFTSISPAAPRIYLISRRLKDLEKQSVNASPFVLFLRKRLSGAVLRGIEKLDNERVLKFAFSGQTELGETVNHALIIQLTGRSANIFLLDARDFILDAMRENSGEGQEIGTVYAPPFRGEEKRRRGEEETFPKKDFATVSEALDDFYQTREAEIRFQSKAQAARNELKQKIAKREKLVKNLSQDLANHGDAEQWKRFGDLLLANLANAKRSNGKVFVTDFYDENLPQIEIEIEENQTITEAAEKFFRRYTKARNAREEISKRLDVLNAELVDLEKKRERLEQAVSERDFDFLDEISGKTIDKKSGKRREKNQENFTGARNYLSSDGFEILVGKGAKNNDFLTFRVAKSQDLWLHAADYPGSHVVVRNPNRREIPPKTLIEAAQLAAFFSQAKSEAKVAVHYTPKKFVFKPKGGVPGLVNLSSFKTILVEPKITDS
jgi:predicted ribosome quality control (RQC) complex YloA/Tae2 family protein